MPPDGSTPTGKRRRALIERFWKGVQKGDGCWPRIAAHNGLGYTKISVDGKTCYAHRVSWEIHNGPIPNGLWVLHHCDNPPCVNPAHLFLGDRGANVRDCVEKGRHGARRYPERYGFWRVTAAMLPRGERHFRAVLTDALVRQIRTDHAAGESGSSIARRLGISQSTASSVITGKTWTHVL